MAAAFTPLAVGCSGGRTSLILIFAPCLLSSACCPSICPLSHSSPSAWLTTLTRASSRRSIRAALSRVSCRPPSRQAAPSRVSSRPPSRRAAPSRAANGLACSPTFGTPSATPSASLPPRCSSRRSGIRARCAPRPTPTSPTTPSRRGSIARAPPPRASRATRASAPTAGTRPARPSPALLQGRGPWRGGMGWLSRGAPWGWGPPWRRSMGVGRGSVHTCA